MSQHATEPFYIAHCRAALTAEPDWTIRMYCIFNDFDDDIESELRRALPELAQRDTDTCQLKPHR